MVPPEHLKYDTAINQSSIRRSTFILFIARYLQCVFTSSLNSFIIALTCATHADPCIKPDESLRADTANKSCHLRKYSSTHDCLSCNGVGNGAAAWFASSFKLLSDQTITDGVLHVVYLYRVSFLTTGGVSLRCVLLHSRIAILREKFG